MKILIIGNGFDLAHGLPTTYDDFLNFIEKLKDCYGSWNYNTYSEDINVSSEVFNYLKENFSLDNRKRKAEFKEVLELCRENVWIKYFLKKREALGKGWIDFENEICNVIKALDYKKKCIIKQEFYKEYSLEENKYYDDLLSKFSNSTSIYMSSISIVKEFDTKIKNKLEEDLKKLIRCLEIYLSDCVGNIFVDKRIPEIEDIEFDKVISFNYTNTYERLYNVSRTKRAQIDYIHGNAESKREILLNNMVLGIDEYLPDSEKNSNLDFITFKKYYQRIDKNSQCEYKTWINQKFIAKFPDIKKDTIEVTILGHSLDVTDKDILSEIINNENVSKVTIYHHKREIKGDHITNLVKVIGQDTLNKYYFGNSKKIFLKLLQNSKADVSVTV